MRQVSPPWRRAGWLAGLVTIAIIAVLVGTDSDESEESAAIALGSAVYAENCAACHGADLEGQPNWQVPLPSGRLPAPPHDATGHTWHHSDGDLVAIIKFGMSAVVPGMESDMPAFADVLSDDEITAVLTFIKDSWPEQERAYQAAQTLDRP